jgi:hypothetical protein
MLSIINQEREIGEMITETTRLVLFRNKIEALVGVWRRYVVISYQFWVVARKGASNPPQIGQNSRYTLLPQKAPK